MLPIQGIKIAKQQGKYKGRKKKYHAGAVGKDKIIYDENVKELRAGTSIMDIYRKTGVAVESTELIRESKIKLAKVPNIGC